MKKSKLWKLLQMFITVGSITILMSTSSKAAYTPVTIDANNFPDKAFRTFVKTLDTNGNDILDENESFSVTEIKVSGLGIKKLSGLKHFPNLELLDCKGNQIQKLNLNNNNHLRSVECDSNELLYEINISNCPYVFELSCSKCVALKSLSLSNNNYINTLNVSNTGIEEIDVSNLKYLSVFSSESTPLKALNLKNNTGLCTVKCAGGNLQTLDVGNCTNLRALSCASNRLSKLDLSGCPYLEEILCNNNKINNLILPKSDFSLTKLMCQGNEISELDISNMPNLLTLGIAENHLWCVDLCKNENVINMLTSPQRVSVETGADMVIDLSKVKGLDVSKITSVKNATLKGDKLTAKTNSVSYVYQLTKSESFTVNVEVKVHEHAGTLVEEKEENCGQDGNKKYYTCACDNWFWDEACTQLIEDKMQVILPKTNEHAYVEDEMISESTCVAYGEMRYICGVCEDEKIEKLPLKKHENRLKMTPASLSQNGMIANVCKNCGKKSDKLVIYRPKSATVKKMWPEYNGKNQKPVFLVKDVKGKEISTAYYKVTYPKAIKVGEYKAKLQFTGCYKGKLTAKFYVLPAKTSIKRIEGNASKLTIFWEKKTKQVEGYEIQYSTDANFSKKATKTLKVTSKNRDKTQLSGLKKGKVYYFRVRTYKKVSGKQYYSLWSKTKKASIK